MVVGNYLLGYFFNVIMHSTHGLDKESIKVQGKSEEEENKVEMIPGP